MEYTFRWFGPKDPAKINHIRQIGGTGIVTSLNHIKYGEKWTDYEIKKYGFAGIVCSAQDIQDIKRVDDNLLRVCPGINFKSSNSGQVRTTTPRRAQEDGADYAIIGRSITKANHPVETIEKIKKTLEFRLIP